MPPRSMAERPCSRVTSIAAVLSCRQQQHACVAQQIDRG